MPIFSNATIATGLLEGRVALVTGGTGGLGQAAVEAMLAAGATVHVTYRRPEGLAGLHRHLGPAAERVQAHAVDLTQAPQVDRLFQNIAEANGRRLISPL